MTLKPEEFRLLRDLFVSRAGLQFGPEFRYTMERRLRDRLMVRELETFSEYHHYLQFGARAAEGFIGEKQPVHPLICSAAEECFSYFQVPQ